jgi:hypothetical protein
MDIGAWLKDMTGLGTASSPDANVQTGPSPNPNPAPSTPTPDPPSTAPRIAAAAALAAYAATPGVEPKAAKKEPNGVALTPFSDSFDISTQITATPEQLQVRQKHFVSRPIGIAIITDLVGNCVFCR